MKRFINRVAKSSAHTAVACFLLILPVGYIPDGADTTNFGIGVHGGMGQVVSVLRDCNGNPVASEESNFYDVSGEIYKPIPVSTTSTIVLGMRLGHWSVPDAGFPVNEFGEYVRTEERDISETYYNPFIALERKRFGIGFGAIIGDVPLDFGDYRSTDPLDFTPYDLDELSVSWHVRFGNYQKLHFLMQMGEATPILSGGGPFTIGLGYPAGEKLSMYSGLSAGFFNRGGVFHSMRIASDKNLDFDVTLRLGEADKSLEASLSGGLIYRFGK
jgi:hypothetical protein